MVVETPPPIPLVPPLLRFVVAPVLLVAAMVFLAWLVKVIFS